MPKDLSGPRGKYWRAVKGMIGFQGYKVPTPQAPRAPQAPRPMPQTYEGPGRKPAVDISRWFWNLVGNAVRDDGSATRRAEMKHGVDLGVHEHMGPHPKKMTREMRRMKMRDE